MLPTDATHPLLRVSQIRKAFNGKLVLDGLSLDIQSDEVVCVLGESGCGKTTLLRCLNLLERIDSGSIDYRGQRIVEGCSGPARGGAGRGNSSRSRSHVSVNEDEYRRRFGVVFQSFNLFRRSVLENVIEGPVYVLKERRSDAIERARGLLASVGMAGREAAYPEELSGGEQQRVAIARALAMRPECLLLDEITSALDPPRIAGILGIIRELRASNRTAMVIVTHQTVFARDVADRVCFIHNGRVAEEGPAQQVLDHPRTESFAQFLETVRASR